MQLFWFIVVALTITFGIAGYEEWKYRLRKREYEDLQRQKGRIKRS